MISDRWIAYCRAYGIHPLGASKVRYFFPVRSTTNFGCCPLCHACHSLIRVVGYSLIAVDELFKNETSQIHRAELAQPLCTAIQIALVNVFRRSRIQPTSVVGHSSGEIAAAYAARAISFREATILSYYRGYVAKTSSSAGGMAAIGLGAGAAARFLKEGVEIACENSSNSVTLSGDKEMLDNVVGAVKESNPDVLARTLKVDVAYHSRT